MFGNQSQRDFLSINLGLDQDSYNNSKGYRKQSIWRAWKRLSSLQRTVILLVLFLGLMSAIYLIPGFLGNREHEGLDLMTGGRNKFRVKDGDLLGVKEQSQLELDKEARLRELKKKAQEQLNNIMQKVNNQSKRGFPHVPIPAPDQVGGDKGNNEVLPRPDTNGDSQGDGMKKSEEQVESPVEKDVQKSIGGMGDYDYFDPNRQHNTQQKAIIEAYKEAWEAYDKYAWGHDEFHPVSKTHSEWFGVGLTIVDSLDTAVIMGLKKEYDAGREFVEKQMKLDQNRDVNLFEITIRVLGGFLSVYHLTGDELFKEKAIDLGNRLLPCFNTKSRVPFSDVNLKTGRAHAPKWGPDSSTSEVTTIQLEFKDLSKVTGDSKYKNAAEAVSNHVHGLSKKDGLVPIFINAQSGQFRASGTISLGARGDSYYEYLIKQWLQTGKTEKAYRDDFVEAVEGMKKHLLRQSEPSKLTYFGELLSGRAFSPKMDHLVCFLGGTLALGQQNGLPKDHFELGEKLTDTCYQMYSRMPTKLSPEIVYFNQAAGVGEDLIVKPLDAHNLLRPETLESIFYMYRITKDEKYREWGWKIFQAFMKHTRVEGAGFSSIRNVKNAGSPGFRDKLESFFLAETLKYLYLLFSDDPDLLPLDKVVFNTEAHPLPIYDS